MGGGAYRPEQHAQGANLRVRLVEPRQAAQAPLQLLQARASWRPVSGVLELGREGARVRLQRAQVAPQRLIRRTLRAGHTDNLCFV